MDVFSCIVLVHIYFTLSADAFQYPSYGVQTDWTAL